MLASCLGALSFTHDLHAKESAMKRSPMVATRAAALLCVLSAGCGWLLGCGGPDTDNPLNNECTDSTYKLVAGKTELSGPTGNPTTEAPRVYVTCRVDSPSALYAVTQSQDKKVAGASIDWIVLEGSGTVGASTLVASTLTDDGGVSFVVWTLGPTAGAPQRLQARYREPGASTDQTVEFTATATASATKNLCAAQVGGTQQAPVGGDRRITADETWTAAASPHRGGTVRVHDGAVLTIEAGATVCLAALYMESGRLAAQGQDGMHVVFTLADPSKTWGGLFFYPPIGASLAGPSILSFVDIENPASFFIGSAHPVRIQDSRVSRLKENMAIGYCPSWYLTLSDGPGGSSMVERVVVDRFGGQGCAEPAVQIVTDNTGPTAGRAFEFLARVLGSGGDGVHLQTLSRAVNISGCEISGSAGDGLVWTDGPRPVTVSDCNIAGNGGVGIRNRAISGQLTARGNWWGDAAGPGGPAGDGIAGDVDASAPSGAPVSLSY